jgi:hypothetical protein
MWFLQGNKASWYIIVSRILLCLIKNKLIGLISRLKIIVVNLLEQLLKFLDIYSFFAHMLDNISIFLNLSQFTCVNDLFD